MHIFFSPITIHLFGWLSRESNWNNGGEIGMRQIKENNNTFILRNKGKDIKVKHENFFEFSHYIITISVQEI